MNKVKLNVYRFCGGMVASCLVCSPLDGTVRVQPLARDIVLCSCERHWTLTVPLSTQVYMCKWLSVNLMLEGILQWTKHTIHQGCH